MGDTPGTITLEDVEARQAKAVSASEERMLDSIAKMLQDGKPQEDTAPAPSDEDPEEAEMHLSIARTLSGAGNLAEKLDKMLFNIPVGTVLVGGIPALVITGITDGMIPVHMQDKNGIDIVDKDGNKQVNFVNIAVKGAEAALMLSNPAKRILGQKAANFAAAAITIQAVVAVLPVEKWVDSLVKTLSFKKDKTAAAPNRQYNALAEAEAYIAGPQAYEDVV